MDQIYAWFINWMVPFPELEHSDSTGVVITTSTTNQNKPHTLKFCPSYQTFETFEASETFEAIEAIETTDHI